MLDDPRPAKYRKMEGYQDRVRNILINYTAKTSEDLAFKYLHKKANVQVLLYSLWYFHQTFEFLSTKLSLNVRISALYSWNIPDHEVKLFKRIMSSSHIPTCSWQELRHVHVWCIQSIMVCLGTRVFTYFTYYIRWFLYFIACSQRPWIPAASIHWILDRFISPGKPWHSSYCIIVFNVFIRIPIKIKLTNCLSYGGTVSIFYAAGMEFGSI